MSHTIIDVDAAKSIEATVKELNLPRLPLIILLGDFDPNLSDQVLSICSRVIAPSALDPGALVLDDARSSGCAALMGQAALDQDKMPQLLGIIPKDRADSDIDPNHEVVLRLPDVWSDSPKWTFQIIDELAKDGANPTPVLAVLFGGKDPEKKAVIRCARRDWPVLVISKTGGLADQIIKAKTPPTDGTVPTTPLDPELREIVETATIYPASIDSTADDLARILLGRIDAHPETLAATLKEVWSRLDELDRAAMLRQKRFRRIELALIILAVLAALFAILTVTNVIPVAFVTFLHEWYVPVGTLHFLVVLTPIAISILSAYNSHFRDGTKWILLRGAAEALKREVFRFRSRAGAYSDEQCLLNSRESKLAARVKDITSSLEQSEVNKINIDKLPPNDDSRESFLTPDEYVDNRIHDQVSYFVKKTRALSRQLSWMQAFIYVVGGTGTLLAAFHKDPWVALATAVVTAITTKLQADQVETSLVQYNQALTSLRNIDAWWKALSRWEKMRRKNIDLLVDQT